MTAFLGTSVPLLPDAACCGRWSAFDFTLDENNPTADARALDICRECPELQRCREWLFATPPSKRPLGVVAGLINRPKRRRTA